MSESPSVELSVKIDGVETFRVAADQRCVAPAFSDREYVLQALANALASLVGTDLGTAPPEMSVRVERCDPAPVLQLIPKAGS